MIKYNTGHSCVLIVKAITGERESNRVIIEKDSSISTRKKRKEKQKRTQGAQRVLCAGRRGLPRERETTPRKLDLLNEPVARARSNETRDDLLRACINGEEQKLHYGVLMQRRQHFLASRSAK